MKKGLELAQKKKSDLEEIQEIDVEIQIENSKLSAASVVIEDGKKTLNQIINSTGKVNKSDLVKVQMLLDAGVEKVASSQSKISDLQKKKNNILVERKKWLVNI